MKTGHVVAIGECGLDFDRLQHCTREVQMQYFELQFKLAEETQLPMFLHSRATAGAMVDMLKKNRSRFTTGVVHSFDGDAEEAAAIVALDLYIGMLCSVCCVHCGWG
jgi:TatD DNase family protein